MHSLLIVGTKSGVYDKIVCHSGSPTQCGVGFFSFAGCIGVVLLVWGFLSEEVIMYVAVDSVSVGVGEPSIHLCRHLDPEPSYTFYSLPFAHKNMLPTFFFMSINIKNKAFSC